MKDEGIKLNGIRCKGLFVAGIYKGLTNDGPGARIGLWVSGCSIRCPGCIAPEIWDRESGLSFPVDAVVDQILSLAPDHQGITVSGGEPFDQAGALSEVLVQIKARTNLDVIIYSGYTIEEIRNGPSGAIELLSLADVLIDGRFIEEEPCVEFWKGSRNQKVHFLTAKGKVYRSYFMEGIEDKRKICFEVTGNSHLHFIGIPARGFFDEFSKNLKRKGIILKAHNLPLVGDYKKEEEFFGQGSKNV